MGHDHGRHDPARRRSRRDEPTGDRGATPPDEVRHHPALLPGILQPSAPAPVRVAAMRHMQRAVGNRGAQRYLQRATVLQRDGPAGTAAPPAQQSPAQQVEAAWVAAYERGTFADVYRILDGLQMGPLLQTLLQLVLPIGIARIMGNIGHAVNVRKDRLMAAMLVASGRKGPELDRLVAALPDAEKLEIRNLQIQQASAGAALKEAEFKAEQDLRNWLDSETKLLTKHASRGLDTLALYVELLAPSSVFMLDDRVVKLAIQEWASRHNVPIPAKTTRRGKGVITLPVTSQIETALKGLIQTYRAQKQEGPGLGGDLETEGKADAERGKPPIGYSFSIVLKDVQILPSIGGEKDKVSVDLLAEPSVSVEFNPPLDNTELYKAAIDLVKLHLRHSKTELELGLTGELKALGPGDKPAGDVKLQAEVILTSSFSLVAGMGVGAEAVVEKPDPGKVPLGKGLGYHWNWSPFNAGVVWHFK
jgi:hypothetical protein